MHDKFTYEFAVIRLVPKVEREEFLNIGVILFCKKQKFLQIKYFLDINRIQHFSPAIDIDLIQSHLNAWEKICSGLAEGGVLAQMELASRFRYLTASKSTMIQTSRPHPGLTKDCQKELENLFHLFVK